MEEAGLTKKNDIKSFTVQMEMPTLSDTMPDNERLLRAIYAVTWVRNVKLPYFALKKLPNLLRQNEFKLRCISERSGEFA